MAITEGVNLNGSDHVSNQNDQEKAPKTNQQQKRSPIRALIQDFSPLWFTWCMNAGIIAILLHQLPYQFNGEKVLSTIGFILVLVLFVTFSIIFLARLIMFGKEAYYEITGNNSELALTACWPISWVILAALTSLIVSQASWGGYSFTIVAYVMWWIGMSWMVIYLHFVFIILIRRRDLNYRALPPLMIIPAVGVTTVAATGGLISSYSYAISAKMAVPIIITSFLVVGIGIFVSIFLYTILLLRLFSIGWPASKETSVMFVFVGPMGQSAAALQVLGSAASQYHRFRGYHKGSFLRAEAAASLEVVCILLGLLMTGMGCFWAFIAVYVMIERAFQRQLTWTPGWNSIIFPMGTLTTSILMLSIELDSPAFKTVAAGLLILLVFFFFLNMCFTVLEVFRGNLLIVRDDPRLQRDENEARKEV